MHRLAKQLRQIDVSPDEELLKEETYILLEVSRKWL